MFKKKFLSSKNVKWLVSLLFLIGGIFLARLVFAQDFGTNAVSSGLGNSLTASDPRTIAGRIINIALGFLGVVAVGFLVYAGFIWMTSNGDEEKIEKAKKILRNGIIGLVIVLASWGIATFILSRLGGAMNGNGNGSCIDGQTASCGCGGAMSCSSGSWGACIGSDCSSGGGGLHPTSCDSSVNPGCQAAAQICAPGDYCDATDCSCKPQGGSGSSCNADLNGGTCSPDSTKCAQYLSCDPQTCTCFGPPVITGLSPVGGFCADNPNKTCTEDSDCGTTCDKSTANGAANNFVTITGKNFGTYSATSSKVVFEGSNSPVQAASPSTINPSCVSSWTDTQIIVAVPSGVSTGPVQVVSSNNTSDTTADGYGPKLADFQANNIVRPGLCNLTPNTGGLSSSVNYQGVNLYSGQAYFGNYQSNVKSVSSTFNNPAGLAGTAITPNIQSGTSGSFVQSNINGHKENSNFLEFTKTPEPGEGPFISSFTPETGSAGQYVTIHGKGFGGARGTSHVYFGATEAAYDFPEACATSVWKDDQVIVKVPVGLADGDDTISINLGKTIIDTQKLNPSSFRVDKNSALNPSLCKIDPVSGPTATPISLWGEYFGRLNDEGLVKFNYDKSATGTIKADGRANLIETVVPAGAITGPVRVIKNNAAGNELNFNVGACTADADCGTQICCPESTYKRGRCANTLADCFIEVPTSVLEWSFSSGFSTSTPNPYAYSCAGIASYYGACQTGQTCPNLPGSCSPSSGGQKIVGECDYSCVSVPGCNGLGANNCSYDSSLDKCLKNGEGANCDLDKTISYTLNNKNYQAKGTCNSNKHWEFALASSCPSGWTRASGNKCVDLNSNCSICSSEFKCQDINSAGRCVSDKLCSGSATCSDNPAGINPSGVKDKCVVAEPATCSCCCTIGQDAQDCCAYTSPTTGATTQLKCEGTCGSDTSTTDGPSGTNVGLGKCGGCKSAGNTPAERDAACNCSGHNGQFCDINNPSFPDGVCTDCSNLSGSDCTDHSSYCCLDAKKTTPSGATVCRGGNGLLVSNIPGSTDYGYCAYYNCSASNPTQCASSTPVKAGTYSTVANCTDDCPKSDPCPALKTLADCQQNSRCCFDSKNTADISDDVCRSGEQIASGPDAGSGYCSYYNCDIANPTQCASSTPVKLGSWNSLDSCNNFCANQPQGPGLSCAGNATSTCASDKCNYPGFGCFSPDGKLGVVATGCGTCCCQPGTVDPLNPNLKCLADKGDCTGVSRGLYCGCSKDSECGSAATVGCGSDTCCAARPSVVSSSPAHLDANVCRNAAVKVDFDMPMDLSSFNSNVILLEERDYGTGVCPTGTFVGAGNSLADLLHQKNKNFFERLYNTISLALNKLTRKLGGFNGSALADIPSASKLYCAVKGAVSSGGEGENDSLLFTPQKLLAANTNYYLVMFGDADLNSKSGLMSLSGVGFNGKGYFDTSVNSYVSGENIKFNGNSYKNSQIIKFTTLSDQGPTAGVCSIDHVTVTPASYLFNTSDNSLDEDDSDPTAKTFDTKADHDKVFTALAYSASKQIIHPVTGYFWDWDWSVNDNSIAAITPVSSLPSNQVLVTAKNGITDSETKMTATVNMNRFTNGSCQSGNCSCQGINCANNCCNAYSGGDGFNALANIYVFICNNPWPPVASDGTWSPWTDTCQGSIGGNCSNYNYKFYYCRDSGTAATTDDLPAIVNQAVIRGQSSNFICSSDHTPCANQGQVCGADKNGDGTADGMCIWDVLKESYFFREAILSAGTITGATDQQTSGTVRVAWSSNASQVGSYKVYYVKSGKGTMLWQEFRPTDIINGSSVCSLTGGNYNCSVDITGLDNNSAYVFKVSVVSVNKTESQLSEEKTATPTDKTPAGAPTGLKVELKNDKLVVSWDAVSGASFYRLYHGLYSLKYGESFDSEKNTTQISFDKSQFKVGDHYLAVSAIDPNGNESAKSLEINFAITSCATPDNPTCLDFAFFENILTNIDFEKTGSGGLPQDWSASSQRYSSVKVSQAEHLSGTQSVLLHQDAGFTYPGTCSQNLCTTSGICTWNAANSTCTFSGRDDCHLNQPAVYNEGQTLCWGNTNRVMWLRIAYSLAHLNFKVGDTYVVNFYYKGNNVSDASVVLSPSLGWSSQCISYSTVESLTSPYLWQNGQVVPTPAPGVDPCHYGKTCSAQANYCCAQAPVQTKCYGSQTFASIPKGTYNDWTWYYSAFTYTPEMASWLNSNNQKLIEIGASIGYNSTVGGETNLYIDDFTVKRVAGVTQTN